MVHDPRFRRTMWRPAARSQPERAWIGCIAPARRLKGKFVRDAAHVAEPDRTERLLRRPLAMLRENGADTLDVIRLPLMARSGGGSALEVYFEYTCQAAQMLVAALYGVRAALTPSTAAATAQAISIITIQLSVGLFALYARPSVDPLVGVVVGKWNVAVH